MTERDLARMFQEFNTRFFGGQLPMYRIRVVRRVPAKGHVHGGLCDRANHRIYISESVIQDTEECVGLLLHEMAHAASGDWHGQRFKREMARLKDAGAPVSEADFRPPLGPERLTRKYVEGSAQDFLTDCEVSKRPRTFRRFVRCLARDATGLNGADLTRRYPWIRAAWRRARREYAVTFAQQAYRGKANPVPAA